MGVTYHKAHSVARTIRTKSTGLDKLVLDTMAKISEIVGATLGPGGQVVLIERQEYGLPSMLTKDGVTVFRSLGFKDPIAHIIMETARDASVRTATEAGDGTTTATILAEAFVRNVNAFCAKNPEISPQLTIRKIEKLFKEKLEPAIRKLSRRADLESEDGKRLLRAVAAISANGDTDLADAVMECYDIVGDNGNVTIAEVSGPSRYEVERIEGFPITTGWEDSCGRYYASFINDPGQQQCKLEKPVFILYYGRIVEFQTVLKLLLKIGTAWSNQESDKYNVVLVATGFSDAVLGNLAANFVVPDSINVIPIQAPHSPVHNGQLAFIEDLAAVTGAKIFDPIQAPLEHGEIIDLGGGIKQFEAGRFRSNLILDTQLVDGELVPLNEETILAQALTLNQQAATAGSQLERELIKERIAKITGGVAKLKVIGSSSGELREKKDRADDAVCSVRGAIKHGVLPGGGWTLVRLADGLDPNDPLMSEIVIPALLEPVVRLFKNAGYTDQSITEHIELIRKGANSTYDVLNGKLVDPYETGILDSTPAVLEALRNSISVATLLGTLGGAVAFPRIDEIERQESKEAHEYLRNADEAVPGNDGE